ncbi:MAG: hypothetical protein ACYTFW_09410 [Planctomycetota bacterium]
MKVKIDIELPDNCHDCGKQLSIPFRKSRKGEHLVIERVCHSCKKIDRITVRRVFTEEIREAILCIQ